MLSASAGSKKAHMTKNAGFYIVSLVGKVLFKSFDDFCNKFSSRIGEKYIVHTKDYKRENGVTFIPVYMLPFL